MQIKRVFTGLLVALFILVSFNPITKVQAYDEGYKIENYRIVVDVAENGVYSVKEYIQVNFLEHRHGIYRQLPISYQMSWDIDGKQIDKLYKFPISDIKVNAQSNVSESPISITVRIGNPDRYVIGIVDYVISYKIHTADLELDGKEAFYLNLIGTNWDTQINLAEFTINFPKAIDFSTWSVNIGSYGVTDGGGVACQYKNDVFQVNCTASRALAPYEGITAFLNLTVPSSEGNTVSYFKYPDYSVWYIVSAIFGLVLLGLAILLFFIYGKDDELIIPIEFTAPKGLDAASVGYLINQENNTRDIVGLFLQWAKDGYIVIDDTKKSLTFTKQKELADKVPVYQKTLFRALFKDGDEVDIKSLKGNFAEAIKVAKSGVANYFIKKRKIFTSSSQVVKVLMYLVIGMPLITYWVVANLQHYRYLNLDWFELVFLIVPVVAFLAYAKYSFNNWRIFNGIKRFGIITIGIIIVFCVFISGGMINWLHEGNILYYIIALITALVIVFFTCLMDKKTPYGNEVYGGCLGLYDFINLTEKERLKLLVKDNPKLFYEVLPYAYVFELTDVWQEHFKGIDIPEADFYRSNDVLIPYLMLNNLNRSLLATQAAVAIPKAGGGVGGGGFSGGGFGGGGGFSGGGFGGGGGGSW